MGVFGKEMHRAKTPVSDGMELSFVFKPFTDAHEIVKGRVQVDVVGKVFVCLPVTPQDGFLPVREIGIEADVLRGISFGEEGCLVHNHSGIGIWG